MPTYHLSFFLTSRTVVWGVKRIKIGWNLNEEVGESPLAAFFTFTLFTIPGKPLITPRLLGNSVKIPVPRIARSSTYHAQCL